jgi:PAS domain S-box-containing protein
MADEKSIKSVEQLLIENEELRSSLAKAEKALSAIQNHGNNTGYKTLESGIKGKKSSKDNLVKSRSESTILDTEESLSSVYRTMSDGLAVHKMVYDPAMKAVDYTIEEVNPSFEKITGLKKDEILGKKATEVYSVKKAPYLDIYSEVVSTGDSKSFETFFPPMNKHFHISVFSPGEGKFATVFQDITERKKTEEAIKRSEKLYRAIGESIEYGVWVCEPDGRNIYASESFLKLVGLTQEQCSNFGWGDTLHPDDAERTMSEWKECARTGEIWDIEHRFRGVDGNWHPILARGVPVRDDNGEIIFWAGINLDISKIKKTEEALRQSEERFRTIAETVPVLLCVTRSEDSIVLFTNEVNNKAFGIQGKDIIGTKGPDYYYDPEDRVRMIKKFRQEGFINNYQLKVKRNDGTPFWIMTSVRPIIFYGQPAMIGASIDITESKKIEEALRESEEKYRNLIKYAPAVIYEMDLKATKFISVNDTMCDILKYTREELLTVRPMDLLDKASQINFRERIKRKLEGNTINEDIEYRVRRKDGEWVDALITVGNITYTNNSANSITVIAYDITERKKREETVRESEKKFRELVKYAPTAIYELDFKSRKFITVNDAMCNLSGYSRLELLSADALDLLDERSKRLFLSRINKCLKGEKPDENVEYNVIAKDGRIINAVLSMKFNFNEDGIPVGAMVVGHDITERKRAEEELLKSREALQVSEERFRTLAENIPDMIVRFDHNLHLLYGNKAVLDRTGLTLESMRGKTALEYGSGAEATEKWEETAREVLNSGEPRRMELVNRWHESLKVYDAILVPEKDSSGSISSIISIARDVTEMRQAVNVLRDSEQRLKYHFENSPLAVVEWDKDFKILQWSDEAVRIFGLKKEEVIGVRIDLLDIIYPEDIRKVEETIARLTSGKEIKVISQNRNITKSGEIIECKWYNSVLLDEKGEMSSVISLVEDITLLRKTEKELMDSRESYRELVTNARSIILKQDNNGLITFVNEYAENFFGFKKEELIGKSAMSTIVPQVESTGRDLIEMVEQVIQNPDAYSVNINENIRKNGDKVWIEWHNKAVYDNSGKRSGHIAIGHDITERRRAETVLKESEDRFRTIAESLTVMISITRISDSIITFLNEPFEKSFGFRKGELLGAKFPDIYFYPGDFDYLVDLLRMKGNVDNMEIKVRKTDGTAFWTMTSIRKINFMNEASYLTASIDITETKRAQEELLRLNRTLDAQSKSSQIMMHSHDEFNYLTEVCKIIIEDCGYKMVWVGYAQNDEHKSVKPVAYYGFDKGYIDQMDITWDDSDHGRGPTGMAIKTGKPFLCKNMKTDPIFKPWRKAAIERGYASSIVLPLKSEGKTFGAVTIYSTEPDPFSHSEINLLTELADDLAYGISFIRLSESERSAARAVKESELKLKELIATKDKFFNIVAHDLKNPFTSLLGSSELLYDNINQMSVENIKKLALILNDSAKGGYAILQNLLDWSRSQTGMLRFNPERINLRIIIDENIDNLKLQVTNKGISMRSELDEDLFITSDKNMINTVLRNLLSNAVKYTFKKGTVVVHVIKNSKEVIITVRDSGIGILKEKADTLFKLDNSISLPGTEKEQGTGLGLKLCKEFTEKMGGRIWVESTEGQGSSFMFAIPYNETEA